MINCTYNYTDSFLMCAGPAGAIICSTHIDFTELHNLTFEVQKISMKHIAYLYTPHLIKYKLHVFSKLVPENGSNTEKLYFYGYKNPIMSYQHVSTDRNESLITDKHDLSCLNKLFGLLNSARFLQQMSLAFHKFFQTFEKGFNIENSF